MDKTPRGSPNKFLKTLKLQFNKRKQERRGFGLFLNMLNENSPLEQGSEQTGSVWGAQVCAF